jgi:hypothetical protein
LDTTRPGGPDDVKALLRAIQNNLEYHQVGVGTLIAEVRDSMRGAAENTVKTSIIELQTNLIKEMKAIQDGLRGGAVATFTEWLHITKWTPLIIRRDI